MKMGGGWFGCCCNKVKSVECPLCQDEVPLQEMKSEGTHRLDVNTSFSFQSVKSVRQKERRIRLELELSASEQT